MRSANQSCGRYSFVVRAARGHSDAIGDRRGSGNKEMDAVRHWGLFSGVEIRSGSAPAYSASIVPT
jgi:hypothetical protein